jgi:hypothetical protein
MIPNARGMIVGSRVCVALMSLLLAACDGGKPPESASVKPAASAPLPVAVPAPAQVAAPKVQPAQPSAKQKADAQLAARVKAALDAEPQIHGFAIDVTADNGKVALFGTVHTKARREMAERIAKGLAGVKSVDNNLAIVAGS